MMEEMSMRKFITILSFVLCCVFMPSCDVHEFPDPGPKIISFVMNLEYDTELPLYKVVEYGDVARTRAEAAQEQYDIRYIVKAFDAEDENSREALHSFVFTKDDISELGNSLTLDIPEGRYRFIIWTDYVLQGTEDDLYYKTDLFEEITFTEGEHAGSTDMRDAFKGTVTADVSEASAETSVQMNRPLAKFNFVSTDLDLFLDRTNSVSLDGYSVVFRYNGFMPSVYNLHTVKPTDASTGVFFRSDLKALADGQAELGFDYVFTNGNETTVSVAVEVYDVDGKMLSSYKPVDVPLIRSHLTTVKAAFLTSEAGGGVSILPDYDGEHNIIIE